MNNIYKKISQEAEDSLRFYQGMSGESENQEQLLLEMNKLKSALNNNNNDSEKCKDNSLKWSDLTKIEAKKALSIGIVLAIMNQFCGVFALLNYTSKIFEASGSSISPNESAIFVGVVQLIGSYVPIALVDRAGRKVKRKKTGLTFSQLL